jgi:hypothetical protein
VSPFDYTLQFTVPSGGSAAFYLTYMSVVLALTAAIVICIIFVVLRQMYMARMVRSEHLFCHQRSPCYAHVSASLPPLVTSATAQRTV